MRGDRDEKKKKSESEPLVTCQTRSLGFQT